MKRRDGKPFTIAQRLRLILRTSAWSADQQVMLTEPRSLHYPTRSRYCDSHGYEELSFIITAARLYADSHRVATEQNSVTAHALELLSTEFCEAHQATIRATSFDDFYAKQKAQGCPDCWFDLFNRREELIVALEAEALKGICVYCAEVMQYESLEQKNGPTGNQMRIGHIKQCPERPESKLVAELEKAWAEIARLKEAQASSDESLTCEMMQHPTQRKQ